MVALNSGRLQFCRNASESIAERRVFVGVTQLPEQCLYFTNAPPSGSNDGPCAMDSDSAGVHGLQQAAFKFTAVARALGVDLATAAVVGGAGLQEPGNSAGFYPQAHTQCAQSRRVILRLQLNVGKNCAVAAEAAGQAQLLFGGCGCRCRIHLILKRLAARHC